MPFVKKECREEGHCACCVGDLCYFEYKKLINEWNTQPRWTTIHELFKKTFDVTDEQAARTLAFLVFFALKAMPYEQEKIKQNGDI